MKDTELCALLGSGVPAGSPNPYMVIDDGWSRTRIPNVYNGGPFIPNDNFGNMKTVAEDIAAKGCTPGIWIRALYVLDELCPQIPESCYSQNQQYVAGNPEKFLTRRPTEQRTTFSPSYAGCPTAATVSSSTTSPVPTSWATASSLLR